MANADLQLPYGLASDGRLIPVANAERGLACCCQCPKCKQPLIARKGDVLRHHFAHAGDLHCVGAYETMAHRLAKQIISDAGWIDAPALVAQGESLPSAERVNRLVLKNVRLELWQAGFRPDIVASHGNMPLTIEVLVTHACTPAKQAMIAERALATLEVDLSEFRHGFGEDETVFHHAVLSVAPRRWLFHPRQAELDAAFAAQMAEREKRRSEELARKHLEAMAAGRREYQRERRDFEREAVEALGPERAARWATETHYIQMRFLYPESDAAGFHLNWRARIKQEASRIAEAERRKALEADRTADLLSKLTSAATWRLGSVERAQLWLRTTNPALDRQRPISFCVDRQSYEKCVHALSGR